MVVAVLPLVAFVPAVWAKEDHKVILLQEEWRVGDDESEVFFGFVSDVLFGENRELYILDNTVSRVMALSSDGEFLRDVCTEGDGPGEIRKAAGLGWMGAEKVGVIQESPGVIVQVGLDGKPLCDLKITGPGLGKAPFIKLYDCARTMGGNVLVGQALGRTDGGRQFLSFATIVDDDGQEKKRLAEAPFEYSFQHVVYDEDGWNAFDFNKLAVDSEGRIFLADDRTDYNIKVFSPKGDPLLQIHREYSRVPRTEMEIRDLELGMAKGAKRYASSEIRVSKFREAIQEICIGPDGNLWVLPNRIGEDDPQGAFCSWDVFTSDGQYLGVREVYCQGNFTQDRLIWGPDGQAVLVTNYHDAMRRSKPNSGEEMAPDLGPMEVIKLQVVDF